MASLELAQRLADQFTELFSPPVEFRGEITVVLKDAQRSSEVSAFAKTSLGFDCLVDVSSVDNYGGDPRVRIPETDALETNARLERRQDIREAHGHSHGPGPIERKP